MFGRLQRISFCVTVLAAVAGAAGQETPRPTSARVPSGAPTTRPAWPGRAEVQRRIDAVRRVTAVINADGGQINPDSRQSTDVLDGELLAMEKANAGDTAGALAIARTIREGPDGQGMMFSLVRFREAVGDFAGAAKLIDAGVPAPACFPLYGAVADAALDAGESAAAEAIVAAAEARSRASGVTTHPATNPSTAAEEGLTDLSSDEREYAQHLAADDPSAILRSARLSASLGDVDAVQAAVKRLRAAPVGRSLAADARRDLLLLDGWLELERAIAEARVPRTRVDPVVLRGTFLKRLAGTLAAAGDGAGAVAAAARAAELLSALVPPRDAQAFVELGAAVAPADRDAALKLFARAADRAARLADARDPLPAPTDARSEAPDPDQMMAAHLAILLEIAKVERAAGLAREVDRRLAEAVAAAEALPPDIHPLCDKCPNLHAATLAGDALAAWGDVDGAIKLYERAAVIGSAVQAMIEEVDADGGESVSPHFAAMLMIPADHPDEKIVEWRIAQGRFADAAAVAARMPSPKPSGIPWPQRARAMVRVATAMVRAGDVDGAAALAAGMPPDDPVRLDLLAVVAEGRAAKGDAAGVRAAVDQIVHAPADLLDGDRPQPPAPPPPRVERAMAALATVGDAQGAVGALAAAFPTHGRRRADGLRSVAAVLTAAGDFDAAIKVAASIPTEVDPGLESRDDAAGDTEEDNDAVITKADAFADVALAQLASGDRAAFDRTAFRATELTRGQPPDKTFPVVSRLADALDARGDRSGGEAMRVAAVRRMLAEQPFRTQSRSPEELGRRVAQDALDRRGPESALLLAQADLELRPRLMFLVACELADRVLAGGEVPAFRVPAAPPPTGPPPPGAELRYQDKTAREWADTLFALPRGPTRSGLAWSKPALALERIGPEAAPALLELLRAHPDDDDLGAAVASILAESRADPGLLVDLLDGHGVWTGEAAAQGLIAVHAAPLLLARLQGADAERRTELLDVLARGVPRVDIRIKPIPKVDWDLQGSGTAEVIAATGNAIADDHVTAMLLALTRDGDADVRGPAIKVLAGYGDETAVPRLVELLDDSDPVVRNDACLGLARLGAGAKAAVPALRKLAEGDALFAERARWVIGRIEGTVPPPKPQ